MYFRTPYTFDPTTVVDETDYSEVVTIPNQVPPLSEILYRFMEGQDISAYCYDGYDDDSDDDESDMSDLPEERPGFDFAEAPALIDSLRPSDDSVEPSNVVDNTPENAPE